MMKFFLDNIVSFVPRGVGIGAGVVVILCSLYGAYVVWGGGSVGYGWRLGVMLCLLGMGVGAATVVIGLGMGYNLSGGWGEEDGLSKKELQMVRSMISGKEDGLSKGELQMVRLMISDEDKLTKRELLLLQGISSAHSVSEDRLEEDIHKTRIAVIVAFLTFVMFYLRDWKDFYSLFIFPCASGFLTIWYWDYIKACIGWLRGDG